MVTLTWKFDNSHQWTREFPDMDTAMKAVYDFGLFTHPNVVLVKITYDDDKIIVLMDRRQDSMV